jgi:hypothetical protein
VVDLERLRHEARVETEARAAALLHDARTEAERERARARHELEDERRASADAMGDEIGALAATALFGLLEWLDGPELETALGRAALRELGPAPPRGPLVVESARPLGGSVRRALAALLRPGVGEALEELDVTTGGAYPGREAAAAALELLLAASELEAMDIVLRDADHGLVDFPSMRDGREVYLCWQEGEDSVRFYHDLESGFAGRKPIEQLADRPPMPDPDDGSDEG